MPARSRFRTATVLVIAACTLVSGAAAADQAVKLSWKFKKGEKLRYAVDQNTTTEGQFAGQAIKFELKQTLDLQWAVDDVAKDGTAQMTQTVLRARLKATQPGAPALEYDSSAKEPPRGVAAQADGVFKVLVGKPIKVKMSPLGAVSEVTLPEGMADELKRAAGPGPMAAMFNEESVKQMIGGPMLVCADHPVKTGDTWKHHATVSNPQFGGKSTAETTYTYRGVEKQDGDEFDRIGMSVKMSVAPAAAGAPTVEIKNQQSEGDIDFDRTTGHVRKIQLKSKMAMAMTVGGTKLDQTIASENSMRLADGDDGEKAAGTEE